MWNNLLWVSSCGIISYGIITCGITLQGETSYGIGMMFFISSSTGTSPITIVRLAADSSQPGDVAQDLLSEPFIISNTPMLQRCCIRLYQLRLSSRPMDP